MSSFDQFYTSGGQLNDFDSPRYTARPPSTTQKVCNLFPKETIKTCVKKTVFILGAGFLGSIAAYAGFYTAIHVVPIHIDLPVIHVAFIPPN